MDYRASSDLDVIRLPGLFDLATGDALTLAVDQHNNRLHVDSLVIADDLLTTVCITTFGQEAHRRLTISRPAAIGTAILAEDPNRVRPLLCEFPPQHQVAEFGIAPIADAAWTAYVRRRLADSETVIAALRRTPRRHGGGDWMAAWPLPPTMPPTSEPSSVTNRIAGVDQFEIEFVPVEKSRIASQ